MVKKERIGIIICSIIAIVIIGLFCFEVYVGKEKLERRSVSYTKESKISYLTYLKNNNHYDNEYLSNGYNLVANLIDYFNLDYTYTYTLSEKINYELNYDIKAYLDIFDGDNSSKPIDHKEYILLENQTVKGNSQIVKVDLFNQKIYYDTYNSVIQLWKKEVSPNANLKVMITVDWNGYSNTLEKVISDKQTSEFNVPISEKTIDIKAPAAINETDVIKGDKIYNVGYILMLASTLLLLVIDLVCIIYIVRAIQNRRSKYDQKIAKILREFDRAITGVKGKFTAPKKSDNYVEVMDFMELLDAHDNVGQPIMHYHNDKNTDVFVVKDVKITYYAILRRKDFDE